MPEFNKDSKPNPKGESKHIDIEKLDNFNNFWLYLKGGRYRNPGQKKEKLVADLDRVAEELGIDTEELFKKMSEGQQKAWQKFAPVKTEETERIAEEGFKICEEMHEKLIPLFKAIVKLGYTPQDLMM